MVGKSCFLLLRFLFILGICSFSDSSNNCWPSEVRYQSTIRFSSTVPAALDKPSTSVDRLILVKSKIRLAVLWEMAAQLAKPFTVYVIPDAPSTDELSTKRKFRLMFRYSMASSADKTSVTPSDTVDHLLNFERDYYEPLEGTLSRLRMKLASLHERAAGGKKKGKRAKLSIPETPAADANSDWNLRILNADGAELAEDVTNETAFLTRGKTLMINDQAYQIFGPTPSITKAEVSTLTARCPKRRSIELVLFYR